MRVIALVPLSFFLVEHLADVVAAVERAAMVRDTKQLVLRRLPLALVICTNCDTEVQRWLSLAAGKHLLEWGAKAVISSVSGKLTVVFSFSRRMAEW